METTYTWASSRPKDPGDKYPDDKPCVDCDLSDFDEHNCEVEGTKAEAEYMQTHHEKLKQRREQFDKARTDYETARQGVAADLEWIRNQLKRIRDDLECHLDEKQRNCLQRAWEEVYKRLRKCGGDGGCCVDEDDCRFEWTPGEYPTAPDIRATIEDFERRVKKAEDCFDELVKEPEELKDRVSKLKEFVTELAKPASQEAKKDYLRDFAKLLWAEYRLKQIWLGFDTVNEYVDCLCLALNCSLQGRRALAKLHGVLKTLECREAREKDRCAWLKKNVVEEIVAACRRICPPDRPEPPPTYTAA
jgi:hypothetical protein